MLRKAAYLAIAVLILLSPFPVIAANSHTGEESRLLVNPVEKSTTILLPLGPSMVMHAGNMIIAYRNGFTLYYNLENNQTSTRDYSSQLRGKTILDMKALDNGDIILVARDGVYNISEKKVTQLGVPQGCLPPFTYGKVVLSGGYAYVLIKCKNTINNKSEYYLMIYGENKAESQLVPAASVEDFTILDTKMNTYIYTFSEGNITIYNLGNTIILNKSKKIINSTYKSVHVVANTTTAVTDLYVVADNSSNIIIYDINSSNLVILNKITIKKHIETIKELYFDNNEKKLLLFTNERIIIVYKQEGRLEKTVMGLGLPPDMNIEYLGEGKFAVYSEYTGLTLYRIGEKIRSLWSISFPYPAIVKAVPSNNPNYLVVESDGRMAIYDYIGMVSAESLPTLEQLINIRNLKSIDYNFVDDLLVVENSSSGRSSILIYNKNLKLECRYDIMGTIQHVVAARSRSGSMYQYSSYYVFYSIYKTILVKELDKYPIGGSVSCEPKDVIINGFNPHGERIAGLGISVLDNEVYLAVLGVNRKGYGTLHVLKVNQNPISPIASKVYDKSLGRLENPVILAYSPNGLFTIIDEGTGKVFFADASSKNYMKTINLGSRVNSVESYYWLEGRILLLTYSVPRKAGLLASFIEPEAGSLYTAQLPGKYYSVFESDNTILGYNTDGFLEVYRVNSFSVLYLESARSASITIINNKNAVPLGNISPKQAMKVILPPGTYTINATIDTSGILGAPQAYTVPVNVTLKPYSIVSETFSLPKLGTLMISLPANATNTFKVVIYKDSKQIYSTSLQPGSTRQLELWMGTYNLEITSGNRTNTTVITLKPGESRTINLAKFIPIAPPIPPQNITQTTNTTTPKAKPSKPSHKTMIIGAALVIAVVAGAIIMRMRGAGQEKAVVVTRQPPVQPPTRSSLEQAPTLPKPIGLPRDPYAELIEKCRAQYQLESKAGEYRDVEAWRARSRSGDQVRLLVPKKAPSPFQQTLQGALAEAARKWRAVNGLNGVVKMLDAPLDGSCIATEPIVGGSIDGVNGLYLEDMIQTARGTGRKIGWRTIVKVLLDVARTLSEAHQLGIAHGDISPKTVALHGRDTVKIDYWGLSESPLIIDDIRKLASLGLQLLETTGVEPPRPDREVTIWTLQVETSEESTPPIALWETLKKASRGEIYTMNDFITRLEEIIKNEPT